MRAPPSSCRATLALASLMVVALLLFCSTASQARPHGPRSRRYEEQQQEENDAQILAAADAAASPSPSALPTTLALLLAPAPAPSKPAGVLQEAGRKGAAAAPSPSANPAAISHNDAADDDNEEEEEEASGDDEEATSDDGAGDGAAAECSCDKALVSSLKEFKKNKTEQAAATKAAKRAANDMIELFDIKCPISVAGAILRPPSPESAPVGGDGKKW